MAAFIVSAADFVTRPYDIPNVTESPDLDDFLEVNEAKVLRELFGQTFYAEIKAGLEAGSPDQIWVDLRDGKAYEYCDSTYYFEGLKKILIPRLFQLWLRETENTSTTSGVMANTIEHGVKVSPAGRFIRAYNDFARMVGNCNEQENTLYGFMEANDDTYENWDNQLFRNPGRINEHGI